MDPSSSAWCATKSCRAQYGAVQARPAELVHSGAVQASARNPAAGMHSRSPEHQSHRPSSTKGRSAHRLQLLQPAGNRSRTPPPSEAADSQLYPSASPSKHVSAPLTACSCFSRLASASPPTGRRVSTSATACSISACSCSRFGGGKVQTSRPQQQQPFASRSHSAATTAAHGLNRWTNVSDYPACTPTSSPPALERPTARPPAPAGSAARGTAPRSPPAQVAGGRTEQRMDGMVNWSVDAQAQRQPAICLRLRQCRNSVPSRVPGRKMPSRRQANGPRHPPPERAGHSITTLIAHQAVHVERQHGGNSSRGPPLHPGPCELA